MSVFARSTRLNNRDAASDLIPSRAGRRDFAAPATMESAPQVVAFGSSVNLLASLASMLPVDVYNSRGEVTVTPAVVDDPAGEGHGLADWVHTFTASAATSGNTVALVRGRDGNGTPSVLQIVPTASVSVSRDKAGFLAWRVAGKSVPRADVCHYRRYPTPGRVFGASPIAQFASTLGLALSAERFGGQWFSDGAHPSAVLQSDQKLDQATARAVKERVMSALQGSREPAVLGAGLKYSPIQVTPEESQFLETQRFTGAQCARILGPGLAEILGYPSGDSNTYSSREQSALDLVAYTLDPWLVGIERALSRWIGGGRYVRFNRGALLRTDLKTRYEAHRLALGPVEPWMTANETRELEDLPAQPWGDERPTVQGDHSNREEQR